MSNRGKEKERGEEGEDQHNRDKQMSARSHQLGTGILKQNV